MQALSHKEYGELKNLYQSVYAPKTETILEAFTDEDLEFNFTDEYIEEQVEELFLECIEEGYSIDEVEDILTESIESSILLLSEDRYDSAVSASKANAQKPEVKRANRREALKKVGSAVKKVASGLKKGATAAAKGAKAGAKAAGKAAQGGIGLAARAVGTAQRAGERVKSAAKSGYERGRHGASGSSSGSSSSSSSSSSSGSSDGGSSSSSSSGSSDGDSSSSAPAPRKRKDGLLKRGLKKLVRGVSKGVSAAAGAVKAGADSITDRARKEQMNYKDFKTIQELYNSIYESQQVDEELIDEDSRRMSNKQHTKRVRSNIKSFGSDYTPPSNYDPDANRGQGEVLTRKQIEKKRRKALRQEELEATGLFSEKEIEAIMEADSLAAMQARREKRLAAQRKREGTTVTGRDFGHDYSLTPAQQKARRDAEFKAGIAKGRTKKEEVEQIDEISQKTATKAYAKSVTGEYEGQDSPRDVRRSDTLRRNIKRKFGDKAAQHADRAAHAMTFGRNSKFMKMPKKPTNEEVEAVDEGLTGERYKEALKKGKQYSRRVSEDPAKRATRGGRGGESDFGAGDRGTGNRAARRAGTYQG